MLARRYMHEYGATRDHLANVALAFRKHANLNPNATMYHKPMTREDYMNARWISEPLCLFDNCLETDGALAAVIVSSERARDMKQKPAYIHSFGQGLPAQHQTMTNYFCDDPLRGPAWACARQLWAGSEIQPQDVAVAQIYDAFSPLIPLSWRATASASAARAAPSPRTAPSSSAAGCRPTPPAEACPRPTCTASIWCWRGVRQMRGTSTAQVEGAESCLVTSGEGVPTSALLLRR